MSLTSNKLDRRQNIIAQSDKEMLRHQFVGAIEHYGFSREAKGKNFISLNDLIQSYLIDFG